MKIIVLCGGLLLCTLGTTGCSMLQMGSAAAGATAAGVGAHALGADGTVTAVAALAGAYAGSASYDYAEQRKLIVDKDSKTRNMEKEQVAILMKTWERDANGIPDPNAEADTQWVDQYYLPDQTPVEKIGPVSYEPELQVTREPVPASK